MRYRKIKELFREGDLKWIISFLIFIIGIFIVLSFKNAIQVCEAYELDQLLYSSDSGTVGYIDGGDAGIFSYGPYINLNRSNYEIKIIYDTEVDASFDVVYKTVDGTLIVIASGTLDHSKECASETFYLGKSIFNRSFEIRTYYPGQGVFQLKEIQLKRRLIIHPYMWISLVVVLGSILFLCGHSILSVFKDPKAALYWSGFYTMLSCTGIYVMVYSQGQSEIVTYVIADLLIILHSYGGKKEIYCEWFNCQFWVNMLYYIYLVASFLIMDLLMRNLVAGSGNVKYDTGILNVFSFSIIGAIVFLLSLIPLARIRAILYGIIYYCFVLLLAVHTIYFQVFGRLFGFQDLLLVKEGSDYIDYILEFFDIRFILMLFGELVIGIVGILFVQKTVMIRREWSLWIGAVILSIIFYSHTFFPEDFGEWNSFLNDSYIYATMNDRQRVFELCGFYQYEMKDLKKFLFGHQKADKTQSQNIEDFFCKKRGEDGQVKNIMTGVFQDKNVIFVLMESIDDIVCNNEVMPNLNRMAVEGIYFSNMYAPIYGTAATLNSELVTNVGLYAPLDGSLVYSFANNYFPYSLAAKFTEHGYTARQYHYNVAGFYDRDLLNRAFGYEEYVSFLDYGGAECTLDTFLVENDEVYNKLIENEKFFDYVISFSAHLGYDDAGENVQYAIEKYPQYKGMTGSNEIDHYFAKARITDDMLGGLLQRLEIDGLLEKTVIVAVGDHFPYGIVDKETLYQLSNVDKYEQLLYKVPCVIWTPGMEPVEVSKTVGMNDIVPTLINLMGFGDCSMYVGQDIFDENYVGYAYCSDGSWIFGENYYHDGELIYGAIEQEKIDELNKNVVDKITINDQILQTDYYAN